MVWHRQTPEDSGLARLTDVPPRSHNERNQSSFIRPLTRQNCALAWFIPGLQRLPVMASQGKFPLIPEQPRRRKGDPRATPSLAEKSLPDLLDMASSNGAKLCYLGEQLKRLSVANDSGTAEQAILDID